MKTNTQETTKTARRARQRECLPCDLPPFCRNHYYTGKLLTKRDLEDEQRYLMDKMRLHHLALHGWGVVCGLKVKPHPYCPDRRIMVEPGLAIDSCGREIRVLCEVELELPGPDAQPKTTEPRPPEPDSKTAGMSWDTEQSPQRQDRQQDQSKHQYQQEEPRNHRQRDEPQEECEPELDLYVCLRYAECEQEFSPAPFDECACRQDGQQPNRICEAYQLVVMTEKPEGLDCDKLRRERCEIDDCIALYETMLNPCPAPMPSDCLPLAVIRNYRPGQVVTEEMIDNWECRPLLPSVTLLDQLIRCILEKLPTRALTRITDINWTHRGEYNCHTFFQLFIGQNKGFEINFERPVRTEGLSPRTFQAIAVRYVDRANGGGVSEVVPARVRMSADRKTAYLDIDPDYARQRLDETNFDLYLLLRCNLIVDDQGDPVDGDLMARLDSSGQYIEAFPTGDGIAGGTFESWIRVRTRTR